MISNYESEPLDAHQRTLRPPEKQGTDSVGAVRMSVGTLFFSSAALNRTPSLHLV